jgi:plastocyanin
MQVGATPYRFSPSSITINRCDAVKAVYADATGAPHTWQGPGFNSGDLDSGGQSYTYRFTSAGTFNFYCEYHQSAGMTGTVTVH